MFGRSTSDMQPFEKIKSDKPTLYREDFVRQVYQLASKGLTDKQMADILGVKIVTFDMWKKKYPDFQQSLKQGKATADAEVVKSLYKRAVGYDYDEVTTMEGIDGNGQAYDNKKVTRKHIPPDVKAITFWLSNRHPEEWTSIKRREMMELESRRTLDYNNIDLTPFNGDELKLLQKIAVKVVSTSDMIDVEPIQEKDDN